MPGKMIKELGKFVGQKITAYMAITFPYSRNEVAERKTKSKFITIAPKIIKNLGLNQGGETPVL